ncbi:MAG: hypothetical protein GWO08_14630, partial [Gammaproteobacteria bacterium]|nr:hypothetical protein [Gammaproteobacteria bacterium]NIW45449.1 hypothetical protein [Gammaproteobacteria bacterium]
MIFLLILNLALLYGLNLARLRTIETLDNVETTLDDLAHEVVVYDFEIDRAVPLKADVPFQRTMEIPVNTVIPIDQELSVPFKTPAGEIILDVPIKTDFPLDVVIPVNFNETISVDSIVQLNTTIPVEIDIAQTSLAAYLAQARLDVAQLKNRLAFKGDESIPSVELSSKTTTHYPEDKPEAAPVLVADDDTSAPAKKACSHIYWPLQPGTTWTYASQDSSYIQRVDNIVNDQAYLSTQYEGQNLQFQIGCLQQGVGLNYLGDMRRLREFGELTFSNPRGTFLPDPETMAEIGRSWTQENDITGTVEGRQGDKPLIGHITHGLARATYTPM